jgi:two-component system sensor histidine kinase KdpD
MRTGRGAIGIIGIDSDKPGPLLTPDERRLIDALIDQSALAIERVHLVEDMDRVKRTVETDRLRSALLTSISHDLKTPLAAILGAAGTLRDLSGALTDDQKTELLGTMIEESERLNRFIANLLDMTRLESGALAPNTAPYDLSEIVGSALRRAGKISPTTGSSSNSPLICRCSKSTPCCWSRPCSTFSTTPRSSPRRHHSFAFRAGATAVSSSCGFSTKATASRPPISPASSTSSIAPTRAIGSVPAPASGSPSPAASWRRCRGRSMPPTGATAAGHVHRLCQSPRQKTWSPPRGASPLKVLIVDDEPPIRKLLRGWG